MSRERELLRRLVEWYTTPTFPEGYGVMDSIIAAARALLAEPEGENDLTIRVPDAFSRLPLEQWVEFTAKLYRNADGTLLMDGESVTSTPRSRAEAEAMVRKHKYACMSIGYYAEDVLEEDVYAYWLNEERIASAALLAALTGEGT